MPPPPISLLLLLHLPIEHAFVARLKMEAVYSVHPIPLDPRPDVSTVEYSGVGGVQVFKEVRQFQSLNDLERHAFSHETKHETENNSRKAASKPKKLLLLVSASRSRLCSPLRHTYAYTMGCRDCFPEMGLIQLQCSSRESKKKPITLC